MIVHAAILGNGEEDPQTTPLGVSFLPPWPAASLLRQMLGYGAMAFLDPGAAQHGEVPRYFRRLRPGQLSVPLVSLGMLLVLVTFVQ